MPDVQFRFRDDAAVSDPVAAFASFGDQTNAAAVRIEPGDDARQLLPFLGQLKLIEVAFLGFGDGRGYSAARILREAGYAGELRAVGDVLIDQLAILRRCGFDAFAPAEPLDPQDAASAFDRYSEVYQPTTDGRIPIWAKRHG
jgi:uncharacterized protein (DUF934 family)